MISNYTLFEQSYPNMTKPFRKRAEVYIIKDDKLVVGYSPKSKKYSIPGGALNSGESPKDAARRETLEEIGINVKNIKPLNLSNPHRLDYVSIYGGWDKTPESVSRWGEIGLVTYSFVAWYGKENTKFFNKDGDGRQWREEDPITIILSFQNNNFIAEPHMRARNKHVIDMVRKVKNKYME